MRDRAIGLLEEFGHLLTTIRFLKNFLQRSVVGLKIQDHGCMMSKFKHELIIGLLHKRPGK